MRNALKINPNDDSAQFNYGNVLLGLQRLDDAFVVFGKALALNPDLAAAHLNRGSILMSGKRFGKRLPVSMRQFASPELC